MQRRTHLLEKQRLRWLPKPQETFANIWELGAFGLGGHLATRPIKALSEGERMRLCFATVLSQAIHLLVLNESTNHIDIETLDSLSAALRAYRGALIMVTWVDFVMNYGRFQRRKGVKANISHDDTESFDELFSGYQSQILSTSVSASSVIKERKIMVKRAAKHSLGAPKNTALL